MIIDTTIRLGVKKDLPFVLDSWVKSIKHQYPNQYALDFAKHYQLHIEKILDKSVLLVSHLANEPNEIISYLVYGSFRSNQVIHFGYTKMDARKQGIINQLVEFSNPSHLPIIFTHATKNENIMHHFIKKYLFDPSILEIL